MKNILIIVCLIGILGCSIGCSSESSELAAIKQAKQMRQVAIEKAHLIIKAVEAYVQWYGKFPSTLSELGTIPNYQFSPPDDSLYQIVYSIEHFKSIFGRYTAPAVKLITNLDRDPAEDFVGVIYRGSGFEPEVRIWFDDLECFNP